MSHFRLKPVALAVLLCTSPVYAEDDDALDSISLEDLLNLEVVTASKRAQTIDNAPSIITAFTKDDIDKMGVSSLIDVLKHAPGVETSMGANGQWRVSIRGVRKDGNILLLIDGQPFNDFYDGRALFDLPTAFIKRVEVIRGPGSALYGTNAVAGVINVISADDGNDLQMSLESHQGYRMSMNQTKEFEDGGKLVLNIGHNSSDGANKTEDDDFSDPATANTGTTNRHLEESYLSASYTEEDLKLSLMALDRSRGPWVGPAFDFGSDTKIDRRFVSLKGTYNIEKSEDFSYTPMFHVDVTNYDALNEDLTYGRVALNNTFEDGGFTHETYETLTVGGEVQFSYDYSEDVYMLSGVTYDSLKMTDYDMERNYQVIGFVPQNSFANHDNIEFTQADKDRQVWAVYSQAEIDFDPLVMTLGFRYDNYSDFGTSVNPRAGFIYKPLENWSAKLLYGTAFRAPTFKELYDNTRVGPDGVTGNADLEPEETDTLEFGVEYKSDWIIARANVYSNNSDNLIGVFDPSGGGGIASTENLGNIETTGWAAEVIYQVNNNVRLIGNISQLETTFEWSSNEIFDNFREYIQGDGTEPGDGQDELFNFPRTRYNLTVDWSVGDAWNIFASANYGGEASNNNTTAIEGLRSLLVDEYTQYNLSARYQLNSQMSLKFAANNLGDDKNSDPTGSSAAESLGFEGMKQPGTTYQFTVTYTME